MRKKAFLHRALGLSETQSLRVASFESLVGGISRLGAAHPGANPATYGLEAKRDVPYGPHPAHRLDLVRPVDRPGPWPVVLYAHGGGFRLMSKESHWMMALAFARRGYLVANIDYRLAPHHPYPAAHQDFARAWSWMVAEAETHGGDATRIVVAGDSAGANLALSLAIQATIPREEPWARAVFEGGVRPAAVIGLCGLYQVSDLTRLVSDRSKRSPIRRWVQLVERTVIPNGGPAALADLLALVEGGITLEHLPPVFLSAGGADPLLEDSRRLWSVLSDRSNSHVMRVYEGERHAFQLLTWRHAARRSWSDTFAFLESLELAPAERFVTPLHASRWGSMRDSLRRLTSALVP